MRKAPRLALLAALFAVFAVAASTVSHGQGTPSQTYCFVSGGQFTQWLPCSAANPLAVAATITPSGTQNVTGTGTAGSAATGVVTVQGIASGTALNAAQSGTWTVQPGNTANTTAWLGIASSQYPSGALVITASATGTTGATTATLAAHATKTTYVCGFSIRANATAAVTGNATVTGTVTGTLNFTQWTAPTATGLGITEPAIGAACIPGSAANTAIAVVSAAPGTGGIVSVSAWGYQL